MIKKILQKAPLKWYFKNILRDSHCCVVHCASFFPPTLQISFCLLSVLHVSIYKRNTKVAIVTYELCSPGSPFHCLQPMGSINRRLEGNGRGRSRYSFSIAPCPGASILALAVCPFVTIRFWGQILFLFFQAPMQK